MDEQNNWSWVLPAFCFVACLVGLPFVARGAWISSLLIGGTIIFAIWAGVNLVSSLGYRFVDAFDEIRKSLAITKESELAKSLNNLPPDIQTRLLDRFNLSIQLFLSKDGDTIRCVGPTGVPVQWMVDEYLPRCSDYWVCGTGEFGEGSTNRHYCELLTQYLIDVGIVLKFEGGNRPARWAPEISKELVYNKLGYSLQAEKL